MNAIALRLLFAALLIGLLSPAVVRAQDNPNPRPLGAEWSPIDPSRLLDMRGGLQMPSGLALSFGIQRLVYVNGELVASAQLRIPDIGNITEDQAQALAAINQGTVVQVGEGNRFDLDSAGGALVIQNTLDGQDIQALTTLDVSVDTLGMLQQLNTFDALQRALIAAPGAP